MSEGQVGQASGLSAAAAAAGEPGGGGGSDSDSEVEKPNSAVEERAADEKCKIFYHYPAEAGDEVSFTLKQHNGHTVVRFRVKRLVNGVETVVYAHKSRPIPDSERAQLQERDDPELNVKKGFYKRKLKKRAGFSLTPYFRARTPPM